LTYASINVVVFVSSTSYHTQALSSSPLAYILLKSQVFFLRKKMII